MDWPGGRLGYAFVCRLAGGWGGQASAGGSPSALLSKSCRSSRSLLARAVPPLLIKPGVSHPTLSTPCRKCGTIFISPPLNLATPVLSLLSMRGLVVTPLLSSGRSRVAPYHHHRKHHPSSLTTDRRCWLDPSIACQPPLTPTQHPRNTRQQKHHHCWRKRPVRGTTLG